MSDSKLISTPAIDTYHVAVTYSGAVRDRANGNGYRKFQEAESALQEARSQTPDSAYTIFRISVELVQP